MTTLTGYLFTGNAGVWKFSINSDDMSVLIITDTNGVESASFGSPQVKLKIEIGASRNERKIGRCLY
jgi:hypothetical protein